MENELKVIVTADIKNFQAAMSQAENNLKRADAIFKKSSRSVFALENQIAQLSKEYKAGAISEAQFLKETERLNKSLQAQRSNVSASAKEVSRLTKVLDANKIKNVASATTSLGSSTRKMGSEVKGANTVALEFNRIIQDAPFGIMGVGNNLQQLTANFSNLSKNAGGSGKALKAAFASLITGPNVALLAISALTTGLTLLNMGFFDTEKSAKSLADELQDYRDTLNSINRAMVEGSASGDREAQTFNNLRLQAENANIPLNKRIEAVNELQKNYPNYLGNLTQEQILTGDVGSAYEDLTKQIIASARARAFSNEIEKNAIKLRTLNIQTEERAAKILELRQKQDQARADDERRRAAGAAAGAAGAAAFSEAAQIEKEINGLIEEQISGITKINNLKKTDLDLTEEIRKQQELGATFTNNNTGGGVGGGTGLPENIVSEIFNEDDYFKQGELIANAVKNGLLSSLQGENIKKLIADSSAKSDEEAIQALTDSFGSDINKAVERLNGENSSIKDIEPNVKLPKEQITEEAQSIINDMILVGEEVNKLEASFNKLIEDNSIGILNQAAADFGSQIAGSFATGNAVLDNFVKNVFKSVPQIVGAFQKLQAARKAQAAATQASDLKDATSGGIVLGVNAAKALGPLGLAVLPLFIAGALAIISGAFGKSAGGGGSAASSTPQSFGNVPGRQFGGTVSKGSAYIVGEKRPELFVPNTNGMIIPQIPQASPTAYSNGSGQMNIKVEVEGSISGETIRLSNKRANNKVRST